MIEFHPEARSAFTHQARYLQGLLKAIPFDQTVPRAFESQIPVMHHFCEEDLKCIGPEVLIDPFGDDVGFTFVHEGKKYGILGNEYSDLRKLVDSLSRTRSVSQILAQETVRELLCEWIRDVTVGAVASEFIDYLIEKASQGIAEYEVLVPIRFLEVEVPFHVGRIEFRPITKTFVDGLYAACLADAPDKVDPIDELFHSLRPFEGFAAGVMSIRAHLTRAQEIGLVETQKALACLRVFSHAAFHPRISCVYDIWGSERVSSTNALVLTGGKYRTLSEQVVRPYQLFERISRDRLGHFMQSGLETLSALLRSNALTPFQEATLDSVQIYSRSTTAILPSDRLVHILVALESLFLRNTNEPIQQNLSERMAVLISPALGERKQIIADMKKIYSVRSQFIHHGVSIEDYELLGRCMLHAWKAFHSVLRLVGSFRSKDDFIAMIDDKKLS